MATEATQDAVRSGLEPSGLEPSGLEQSGLGPSGLGPSGLGPSGLGPSGLGPSGLDPLRETHGAPEWPADDCPDVVSGGVSGRVRPFGSWWQPADAPRSPPAPRRGPPEGAVFLCVYASQVAACVGMNKYRRPYEALEQMWERVDPGSFRAAMLRAGQKTSEEALTEVMARDDRVRDVLDRSLVPDLDASDAVAHEYAEASRRLGGLRLDLEDRRLVDDAVRRNMFTTYGNRFEKPALRYLREACGVNVSPDPRFHKREQGLVSHGGERVPWYVGGKVDAVSPDGQLVVEIKNRVHRLFYRAPLADCVQLQCYMHVLDAPRGMLMECLRRQARRDDDGEDAGLDAVVHSNVVPVARDDEFWARQVVPKLQAFVEFLARLLETEALQDAYLARAPGARTRVIFQPPPPPP